MSDSCIRLHTLGHVNLTAPGGMQARSVLTQPKRLAFLIYLAAATPRGFHRRDTLLALFWPELPDGGARRALNRAVYYLRQSLDPGVLVSRGDDELGLGQDRVWCDVEVFERALDEGRRDNALQLYQGDFVPGLFVSELPELERWIEAQRARLRQRALEAALELAECEKTRGEFPLAAQWAHRATGIDPYDERAAARHIALLDLSGNRAGALHAYEELAVRLREELGVEPSPETQVLKARVHSRRQPGGSSPTAPAAHPERLAPSPELEPETSPARPSAPPVRAIRPWVAWAVVSGLVAAAALSPMMPALRTAQTVVGKRVALAVAPEFERWPSLSRDGGMVFYTLSGPGGDEVFAQQIDGGTPIPLTEKVRGPQREPAVSPDGTRLLFRGDDGLYLMPALGGEVRQLVAAKLTAKVLNLPGLLPGSWAPDGQRIVYPERDTLFLQAINSTGRTPVVAGRSIHSPAWSPDGRFIAFVEGNPEFHLRGNIASSAIKVVPANGGGPVAVTDASALHTSPVWVPGRPALLFVSDREGGRDVYEVSLNRDGTPRAAPVRITTGLSPERITLSADGRKLAWSVFTETANIWALPIQEDSVPLSRAEPVTTGNQLIEAVGSISPDGAWLYYHGDRRGGSDLWRLPLAGGGAERLTTDSALDFAPAVSPDGKEVAFHSLRTGNRDVFVMPARGGPAVQVSTSPGDEGVPIWSPDGRALIWIAGDTIRTSRRRADGTWGMPAPLMIGFRAGGWAQWSPDGRWISYPSSSGLRLIDPVTGEEASIESSTGVTWHVWSKQGDTVYGLETQPDGRISFVGISVRRAGKKLLGYSDSPLTQLPRYGLALDRGRLYFPLVDRASDVWVADLKID